jgi:hypothetical protein
VNTYGAGSNSSVDPLLTILQKVLLCDAYIMGGGGRVCWKQEEAFLQRRYRKAFATRKILTQEI